MRFEPAPPNDFADFRQVYHERCLRRVPKICAIAAKWSFEDLIPGLSDFDTRFIVRDPMSAADWHAMSSAVGQVHTEMAREFPRWHRNLEHLPGLNLTDREMTDPRLYYTEYRQWTYYDGDTAVIERIDRHLDALPWSRSDEVFHLKKIAAYYGPYIRGIDPPINLGPFESKYPLHSRYMHYFAPPVQAMVSLKLKKTVRGKLDSLRLAREHLPNPRVIDEVLGAVDRHYEIPADYAEPRLGEIERGLERYLGDAWGSLNDGLTLVESSEGDDRDAVRSRVDGLPSDPMTRFLGESRFSRLMEGRLNFYATDVPGFETDLLIDNEIGRILGNLYEKPLRGYARARFGAELEPQETLERIRGTLADSAVIDGVNRFVATVRDRGTLSSKKQQAASIAGVYRPMLDLLCAVGRDLLASR